MKEQVSRAELLDLADFTNGPLLDRCQAKRIVQSHLALLDECESLRERLAWRDIETAGNEYRLVLVCDEHGNQAVSYPVGFDYHHAKYWMPLPDPPEAAISENAAQSIGSKDPASERGK